MDEKTHRTLCAAREAVALASRVTRSVQSRLSDIVAISKDDRSPVTVADFAAQAVVAHHLAESLGRSTDVLRIVGEESAGVLRQAGQASVRAQVVQAVSEVWPGATEDDVLGAIDACDDDATTHAYWTLDPVDGTKGFLRGGQYAVSLAWIEGGRVKLGAMGCPNLSADFDRDFNDPDPSGTVFFAARSEGALHLPVDRAGMRDHPPELEGRPLGARPADLGDLIRVCESVESAHTKHDDTARIVEYLGGAGTPARLDSQAKYAVVARGQADAYLRLPTKPGYVEKIWDHAAGMLVATEAGAVVTDIHGQPLDFSQGVGLSANSGVVCAAKKFHARIIEAIRDLGIRAPEPAETG